MITYAGSGSELPGDWASVPCTELPPGAMTAKYIVSDPLGGIFTQKSVVGDGQFVYC